MTVKLRLKAHSGRQIVRVLKIQDINIFEKGAYQNQHLKMDFSDSSESARFRSSKIKLYNTYYSYCHVIDFFKDYKNVGVLFRFEYTLVIPFDRLFNKLTLVKIIR